MKQDTKHKIIEAGARIIHHKGYHHTGIQEVLKAAGVPKGSFYFYFKNKEDFGLQVISYFDDVYAGMLAPVLEDPALGPLEKIEKIFDHYIGLFRELDFQCGCPVGNLSQEMGDLNPAFSTKLTDSVDRMAGFYRDLLAQARENGELPGHIVPGEMAEFMVTSWHGALMKMKINRSTAPLEIHKKMILSMVAG